MVNRRRNFEAAHSGVMKFYPKDANKIRRKVKGEVERSATDFLHMLNHIAEIEQRMIQDLQRDHLRLVFSTSHPQIGAINKTKLLSKAKGQRHGPSTPHPS
jgi:hypothetical protein